MWRLAGRCGPLYGGVLVVSLLCRYRRFTAKMGSTMASVLNPVAHYQWTEDCSCSVVYRAGAEAAVEALLDYLEKHPGGSGLDLQTKEGSPYASFA